MRCQLELPRAVEAGALARRQLSAWFSGTLDSDELQDVKLLATELVNNAVLHGQGGIHIVAELDDNRVRVEVIDEGQGFEHEVRRVPFEELSGRGLGIVEAQASRWGIHEGTTHVWAEVERTGPRLGRHAKPDV